MADSSTKDRGGNHLILLNFLRFGYFKIGFLGRKITQDRKILGKALASPAEERKPRKKRGSPEESLREGEGAGLAGDIQDTRKAKTALPCKNYK